MTEVASIGPGIYKNRGILKVLYKSSLASVTSASQKIGNAEWNFIAKKANNVYSVPTLSVHVYCKRASAEVSCDTVLTVRVGGSLNDCVVKKNQNFNGETLQTSTDIQSFSWNCLVDPNNGFLDSKSNLVISVDIRIKEAIVVGIQYEHLFSSSSPYPSDCVLIVDGKRVQVLKNLLSMHSVVFKTIFEREIKVSSKVVYEEEFKVKEEDGIELTELVYNEFIELLAAIYQPMKKVTVDNVECLMRLAERFKIASVLKATEEFLMLDTDIPNEMKLMMAQEYHFGNFMQELNDYPTQNAVLQNVINTPGQLSTMSTCSNLETSSGSSGVALNTFEKSYTAEELGRKLSLDKIVIDWLNDRAFDPDDPVLVVEYMPAFMALGDYDQHKNAVAAALVQNGGLKKSETTFFFPTWQDLCTARENMLGVIGWAFYIDGNAAALIGVPAQLPTIRSTVITSITKNNYQIIPHEFFKL